MENLGPLFLQLEPGSRAAESVKEPFLPEEPNRPIGCETGPLLALNPSAVAFQAAPLVALAIP